MGLVPVGFRNCYGSLVHSMVSQCPGVEESLCCQLERVHRIPIKTVADLSGPPACHSRPDGYRSGVQTTTDHGPALGKHHDRQKVCPLLAEKYVPHRSQLM